MLLKFESLFDGTLDNWNLPLVSFELKDGMKPYHGRLHPIPYKHKAVLMKKINWLCKIGDQMQCQCHLLPPPQRRAG
jgi:hypothetical protein